MAGASARITKEGRKVKAVLMSKSVLERIVEKWTKLGIVDSEDAQIYIYGLNQIMWKVINIITAIIIGIIFDMIWQIVIFELAYIPLRTYAGGFHARTPGKCYLYSVVMIIIATLLLKIPYWSFLGCKLLVFSASMVIMWLSPVADKNKPISETERKVYGRRTRLIVMVLVVTEVVFECFGKLSVCACISLAVVLLAGMLILAKVGKTGI